MLCVGLSFQLQPTRSSLWWPNSNFLSFPFTKSKEDQEGGFPLTALNISCFVGMHKRYMYKTLCFTVTWIPVGPTVKESVWYQKLVFNLIDNFYLMYNTTFQFCCFGELSRRLHQLRGRCCIHIDLEIISAHAEIKPCFVSNVSLALRVPEEQLKSLHMLS